METGTPKKRCFIITPIGPEGSTVRRAADGVVDSVILPVLEEMGFVGDVAHRICESGSITKQAIARIVNDDLVIANLTGLNPNVMYELGIRHSARKPVVHICQYGTELPFDIAPERTLFYNDDMYGTKELQPALKSFVEKAMEDREPDNPVYQAVEKNSIMQVLKAEDPLKYIIERLDRIDAQNKYRFDKNINRAIYNTGTVVSVGVTSKNYKTESEIVDEIEKVAVEFNVKMPKVKFEIKEEGKLFAVFDGNERLHVDFFKEISKRLSE